MRSDTLLPLSQLFKLMGVDPWKAAQINRGTSNLDSCQCIAQSGSKAGRDDYIQALQFAESQFVARTKVQPAPVSILGERHPMTRVQVKLDYRRWIAFGTYVNTFLSTETLTRGAPADVFSFTVAVPDNTQPDEIHVFFTNADEPTLEWEIRPLSSVVIDSSGGAGNWEANIEAPAYLFVKPELQTGSECLPHELDTYVEQIKIWRRTVDSCDAGRFVYPTNSGPCDDGVPCGETYSDVCFTHSQGWARMTASACDEDGVQEAYVLERWPCNVEVNYIAGNPLKNFQMNSQDAQILFMLTIANMDCEAALCPCDTCAMARWEKYRAVAKVQVQKSGGGESFMLMVDKRDQRALRGLPPLVGNVQAIGQMRLLYP